MDSAKFSQFNVSVKTYKTVRDHEIQAYILVPKNISPGPHPVIVKIHGGGSVAGSGVFAPWFAQYLLTLALRESAIIIAPNYRLLPESTAPEMISDISDFWTWTRTPSFQSSLPPHITANISHTLLYGDSAGGHLAMLSSLTEPENTIKACIAAYPQLDIEDEWFCEKFEKHPFGVPILPTEVLDKHLEKMEKDPSKRELVSDTGDPWERLQLILVALQQGRYKEMFGQEEHVYPFRVLQKISRDEVKRKMPFLWLYHGEKDSVLPVAGITKFAGKWREAFGGEGLMVHIEEGADHGFDTEADVDAGWVKERLDKVVGVWLR
ncbi:putative alpha beta hydrolase fold-3 domain protein [Botrytis fragariae]|uniref:Putative alpha beta hydrolase fold-3 domain protein n=1 Tax=Botrytis fragariae TaxID=1964551 RepID=A0A8H6B3E9_9HELO|nr:putative alpha beta hydrolase fold-3 domain protein [Botrytis fragariae]KAF5878458.1 putative alpha beta hydrolase fold-3 domain protein [Botrytis fragariae]